MSASQTCLRPKAAAQKLGIGLSTLWLKVSKDPEFPRPVKLGEATTVFIEQEIDAWLRLRIAESRQMAA
ncbi:AlpA family phage regulatory protein [Burkholderia cenocepacia]|uniref:helix-turn-helix transcriptional regulator n=1 Tax=Burkholderia cenocepacia TaxID=95486 RepID=UPI002656E996|nr:AlpA family phage regulatory protein [Burkholderia cenocepacia]MDN7826013.1 AlpA family phage regulatory protein [Burkholderia cenocepacia]HEM9002619.1 AlpA family phage regulatory protein [Burkholderia cenocepacia]